MFEFSWLLLQKLTKNTFQLEFLQGLEWKSTIGFIMISSDFNLRTNISTSKSMNTKQYKLVFLYIAELWSSTEYY